MPIPIEELVRRAREAGARMGDSSAIVNELAFALRARLTEVAPRFCRNRSNHEDAIQHVLFKTLPHLLGEVGDPEKVPPPEKADAYVVRSLCFAFRSLAKRRGIHDPSSLHREDDSDIEVMDERAAMADEELERQRTLECVRDALEDESIPLAHRTAIRRHIVDGVSEDELAREELERNPRLGVDRKRAFEQARNKVYQDVRRGRLAIEARVKARRSEDKG